MALLDWVSVGLLAVAAVVVIVAARRLRDLNRVARERRLARLAAFFDALAVAFAVEALGAAWFLSQDPATIGEGFGLHDLMFWARHAAWLVALLFAVGAFTGPRRVDATPVVGAWLLVAEPVFLLVEGAVLLYLVARTALNHVRRTNLGSLEVALGFAFLAASRFLPFVLFPEGPAPLGAPHLTVALLVAAGAWTLALVVPGRRR